jgi:hypothetical protein
MANEMKRAQAMAVHEMAAATARAGQSTDRVFVADVWDTLVSRGEDEGMTLAQFKALCVELARAGLVTMTRCDLVSAYGADRVLRSECERMGATFHFIAV